MSLHNGDKARDNRRRRARLKFRESIRELKKTFTSAPEKKQKGK
jgi:hypothetical protein